MSTVFDVQSIVVDEDGPFTLGTVPQTVVIQDATTVPNIRIEADTQVTAVKVLVPGLQGAPGLKNVYVQPNDPAIEFGWGPEEAGFIWIEADV